MAAKSLKVKRNPAIDAARTPGARVRIVLLLIADQLAPAGGRGLLKHFEDEYGWNPKTLSLWINKGFVPIRKAELLHQHFSTSVSFTVEDLCPARKARIKPRGLNAAKHK